MIATILLAYLLGGLVILSIFDLLTKRIRNNMQTAGITAQIKMAEASNPIGSKVGVALMLVLTWLFWPLVLIGAATDKGTEGGDSNGTQRQRTDSADREGGGGVNSRADGEKAGKQPDREADTTPG